MVNVNAAVCPKCGGTLQYYDSVRRIVRKKFGKVRRISLRRLRCTRCGVLHRELPERLLPYKQYEAEIIAGVLEGLITSDTLGFENYPSEMTMFRWISQKLQLLL